MMLLEPLYEKDFLPCSYGFRRRRSAHDVLNALRTGIIEQRQRWVIDAYFSKYFDSIRHSHLRSFLDLRIKDGVARRMIDKWLKAEVLEEDALHRPVSDRTTELRVALRRSRRQKNTIKLLSKGISRLRKALRASEGPEPDAGGQACHASCEQGGAVEGALRPQERAAAEAAV